MASKGQEIVSIIKDQIEHFGSKTVVADVGTVIEAGDGIARIHGLQAAKYNELLQFPGGIMGIALNLEEDAVGAVILGDSTGIREGDLVRSTNRIAEVPVGEALIGRVVNALGQPIDGKGEIAQTTTFPVERIAAGVVARQGVSVPVQTGIKIIDATIPIGRGQRELIIGDKTTGKTAIALDTIINQKGKNLICIYVSVGQKASKVAQIVGTLEKYGAMGHTIVVAANASDSMTMQYLAPFSGCAMGEYFMENGQDALIVYDDLTKHAWAYRQMSLLLRRPPGREAYPGDVFYLHSRLLERSARLNKKFGGGSLTALPIIETQAGDVSAYVPTNVISITDGQIFVETDLFNSGVRPAVNIGISVSRVGSSAQTKAMKKVAGKLKLDMAQFQALAAFAQFGTSELDKATKMQLERGQRLTEVLKQNIYSPVSLADQVVIFYAANNGFLDDIPVARVKEFEGKLNQFMVANYSGILKTIGDSSTLDDDTAKALKEAVAEFKKGF